MISRLRILGSFATALLLSGCGGDPEAEVGTVGQAVQDSRPVWERTMKVSVNESLVNQFADGLVGTRAWVETILADVTNRYSDPKFNGRIVFTLSELYVYPDEDSLEPATVNHPNTMLGLIFNSVGKGTYGGEECAKNAYITFDGSVYDQLPWGATGGIAHELGHAQGLGDIYRIGVLAQYNPFNHEAFDIPPTLMADHGINPVQWDALSVGIMNYLDGDVGWCRFSLSYFPSRSGARVVDSAGAPVSGASVKYYPVRWTCDAVWCNYVDTTPYVIGTTNAAGEFVWTQNPFIDGDQWTGGFFAGNSLVEVRKGNAVTYQYLPIWDPMLAYFAGASEFMQLFTISPSPIQLEAEHMVGDGDAPTNNMVMPFLRVRNVGTSPVNLDDIVVEYYTREPGLNVLSLAADIWYFYGGDHNHSNPVGDAHMGFSRLPPSASYADTKARLTFTGGHVLAPGQAALVKLGYHARDYRYNFAELDDWSYTTSNGTYNPAPRVVIRDAATGALLAGTPPPGAL
jgi:hypothetical protein